MPLNIPGLLAPLQLILHPRIVIPNVIVKDIRYLDFAALRKAGYRGAVFDKDNCLTIPDKDTLVPELQAAWDECRKTFGEGNVLIVSNSAGTYRDAGGIQSESVAHHLRVPVLQHSAFKPAYSCIDAIRLYFASRHRPVSDDELVIIGDRVLTDVVLANRMRLTNPKNLQNTHGLFPRVLKRTTEDVDKVFGKKKPLIEGRGPLAVWTTGVWERESMVMRWFEKNAVQAVQRWSTPVPSPMDAFKLVKKPHSEAACKPGMLATVWTRLTKT